MKLSEEPTVYTIGHSNREIGEFIAMLKAFGVKTVVDIRRFPGSRKFPAFHQEPLAAALEKDGISYRHLEGLGGRRPVQPDSENNRWRNASFRGYADYMATDAFQKTIAELEAIARKRPTAYMCAEAVWWRCHRSMVSDALKAKGWKVLHIMAEGKTMEHPYTSPARVERGHVFYFDKPMNTKFKVGDQVSWNSEAGRVSGTIIKIHTSDFDYKGHPRRASEEEPQYEIKSSKTDHIAAHKESALTKI